MANSYHVLVVEDQTNIWEDLTEFFEPEISSGVLALDFAATAREGLNKVGTESKTDVVIIDVILPDVLNGNELYFIDSLDSKFKQYQNKPKGILVSAHKSINILNDIASEKDWIVSAFTKPLNRKTLKNAVEKTLDISFRTKRYTNDSEEIDEAVLAEVRKEADIIRSKMKRSVSDIIDAGKRLHAVKKKIPHGFFKKWIETELGCHYTTGVNLMRVADVFGDRQEKVSNMGVAASILYFLATPSTPKQAREKVIQLIEDGENISYAETKEIVKEYKKNQNQADSEIKEQIGIKASKDYRESDNEDLEVFRQVAGAIQNKQQIVKIIRQQPAKTAGQELVERQKEWQKLRNHWIFNGFPDSADFRRHLRESISLTIAFPNSSAWTKDKIIPPQSRSASIFYSPFKDLDLSALKQMVKNAVELCTEENEDVVFSFLPEPELLLVVESLGCRCIIAEPDLQRYKRILSM
jgi:CheY-like chemotaxis protein